MQSITVSNKNVKIGADASCFTKTTVKELIEKINKISDLKASMQSGRLKFNDFVLEEERTLAFYGIQNGSEILIDKHYDPYRHFGIKFTDAPDAILGENNGQLRALLSCGHAVDPNSLTAYCRSIIDQGSFKFTCPALVDGSKRCNAKWDYVEVRKLALLNDDELSYFERKISELAAQEFVDYKECPKCQSFVERADLTNLRVSCSICKGISKKSYEFCWQCEEEWTISLSKASDTCGRQNCQNSELNILASAKLVKLDNVNGLDSVPSIRACPTCGKLCEHNRTHCKNVVCPRCQVEFCFACLEVKATCSKTSSPYGPCSKSIEPIQTKMPVWKRN